MTHLNPSRRALLGWLGAGAALSAIGTAPVSAAPYRVTMSDADWRKKLGDASWQVLRHEGTEQPFTSPLNNEHRKGTFLCKGCDNQVFASSTKFDSHTGWPSFWQPLKGAVGTSSDTKLGYERIEVHCTDCGGHLGHVFRDGPKPTGLRYCMNGVAMKFSPA